jgi:DNA-directed RNA polymerase subunit E'/Rpb7
MKSLKNISNLYTNIEMNKSVQLSRSVFISPNFIDSNIMKYILSILKTKYEKTCHESDGLILSIDKIIDVKNMISKDSCYIIFDINFQATVIKPEKDLVLTLKPSYLLDSKGIFGKIYDNINIFVPEIKMENWKYSNDSYIKKNKTINKDTLIQVKIIDIKFNSTKYNCICSLLE